MPRVDEKWIPVILFLFLLPIYAAFLTKNYYWDGIYFSSLIEQANSLDSTLIHPNHPFYNPFGYIVYRIVRSIGFDLRAVTALQLANCVLSALASALFYPVLRRFFPSVLSAAALTLLFGFSATWWKFSTDADAYIPSVMFLIVSLHFILPGDRPRPLLLAVTHTVAMCFHQLAVFFFPVAVLGIYFQTRDLDGRDRIYRVIQYAATSFIATFGIYYVCFYLQSGTWNIAMLFTWLTYFSPENGFVFNIKESLTHSFRGQLKLFFEGRFNFLPEVFGPFTAVLLIVLAAAFAGFVYQLYKLFRSERRIREPWPAELRQLALLCGVWVIPI